MLYLVRKRRQATDAGFALPSAILVLFILSMLTGTAIIASSHTSSSTTRDDNSKAALEAAEAGLQVASYRLSKLEPGKEECINASEAKKSESECKSGEEALGNGANFKYWTTLPLAVKGQCAGQEVVKIESGATLRCVTSEGTVNKVTPGTRLRMLVEAKTGESLFSIKGILGLTEVKISGSVKIPAVVASNEKIIGEGSAAFERGFELCPPKGTFTPPAGSERNHSGVTVGGVGGMLANPPLEKTRSASECPLKASVPATHVTAETSEDGRIGVTDPLEGTTTWNKEKYELTLSSNGKVTLGGSKYYFCNFKATNNSRLRIAATAKRVEIFVDSPKDPTGKCKTGGTFEGEGEFEVENETKNPAALLIELYGEGPFAIHNGCKESKKSSCPVVEASIYAPEALVEINGAQKFKGGIVGNKVHIENGAGVFEWNEEDGSLTNGSATGYARKAWEQCKPGAGATEGC
ncbi:MAG TPA: hypothetical protein VNY52_03400 [Solirubrobacteraceae bacterium]|nr:hypothetical protein [Solirubrobacteraceae bacterium]